MEFLDSDAQRLEDFLKSILGHVLCREDESDGLLATVVFYLKLKKSFSFITSELCQIISL